MNNYFNFHSNYPAHLDRTHGSTENAVNHKMMMETIANDIVNQAIDQYDHMLNEKIENMINELCKNAYYQAINDLLGALQYDIESVTKIGIDGCKDIFESKQAQKFISDHIMKEITDRLNIKRFK